MKQTLVLLALFILPFIAHGQQMRISLNVTANPSPYLSDWTTRKQTVILTVVNSDAKSVEVKLVARILRDGALQADTKLDKVPTFTVRPGVNTFYGEDLIPESAVTFYGDVDKKVIRSGRLPSGSYQFCLRLHTATTLAPLGEEQCRPFKIQSYQGPRLLDPAASAKIPPPYIRQTFRWSPVSPAYSPNQQYQLVVMEVRNGQTPTQAFRANRPILVRDIKSATQMLWPTDVALDTPMTYVWSVRALDDAGDPLGEPKDGWAEPRSFSLGGFDPQTQIDDPTVVGPSARIVVQWGRKKFYCGKDGLCIFRPDPGPRCPLALFHGLGDSMILVDLPDLRTDDPNDLFYIDEEIPFTLDDSRKLGATDPLVLLPGAYQPISLNDGKNIRVPLRVRVPNQTSFSKWVLLNCYPAEPSSCKESGSGCLVMFPPDNPVLANKIGSSGVMTGQAQVIAGASTVLVYHPDTPSVYDRINLEHNVVLDREVATLLGYTSMTLQKGTYALDRSIGSFQFAIQDAQSQRIQSNDSGPILSVPTTHPTPMPTGIAWSECKCCGSTRSSHDTVGCCDEKDSNPKMHFIDPKTGAIKYFEYDTDFVIDNPGFCKYLGVKQVVIAKGIYRVERSAPEADGKITLTLAKSVSAEKARSQKPFTFRGTNPKGKDCKDIGNACFFATEPMGSEDACTLTVTPVIKNGECVALELQYASGKGVGTPKAAGF